jgi:glucose-6-phosphate-specific signal transduction histidine kinase
MAALTLPTPVATAAPSRMWVSRDAIAVVAITLATFVAAAYFDMHEQLARLARPFERYQADELLVTLFVLALMLVWFAWRRWRQASEQLALRRVAERALMDALVENRRLSQMYLFAQEGERRSLARELHDELGQCLNAIKLDATAIRDNARPLPQEVLESAQAIIEVSSRVYDMARGLMQRLRPVALDELGLADALRHLVGEWRRRNPSVKCSVDLQGELDGLGEQLNITLYRVVQECLTNVTRHARASTVEIALERVDGAPDELHIGVRDDGVGLARDGTRTGLGLAGLRERVTALEGRLEVIESLPHGVEVRARIPVTGAAQ